MIHAKKYETASKCVKVMPRNTVASLSGHGVVRDVRSDQDKIG